MNISPLDERMSVIAQPSLEDIDALAAKGFRTVISNRPRGESEAQPDMQALKDKAESLGMVWHEIPVKPGEYSQGDIETFTNVLQSSLEPIVGFCRTGKRVAHLWAYSQAPKYPVSDLLEVSRIAGYDLEPMKKDLERYARS